MGTYVLISVLFAVCFVIIFFVTLSAKNKPLLKRIENGKAAEADHYDKSIGKDAEDKLKENLKKGHKRMFWWTGLVFLSYLLINLWFTPTISYDTFGIYWELIVFFGFTLFIEQMENDDCRSLVPIIVIVAAGLITGIYSWDWIHETKKQQMLQVEVVNDSVMQKMISPIPEEKMCIVDPIVAKRVINTLMGDLKNTYSADKLTKQSFTGRFKAKDFNGQEIEIDYKDQIIYVAAFEHKGFFTWFKKPYSEGYAIVNASNEKEAYLIREVNGVPLKMPYMREAFFAYNMERHLRLNGYANTILDDMNIELDENGRPFAPITIMKNSIGLGTPVVDGIALLDVQSGEIKRHSVEDAPAFVNMVYPTNLVYDRLEWWGEYVNGYINPSNTGRMRACEGMDVVQSNDGCYYYVGIQGKKDTFGTEGYMLISTRDGKAKFFSRKGISEQEASTVLAANTDLNVAMSQGVLGLSEPIFYNIEGLKTYFSTYISTSDITVKYYGFCSTDNKEIWGYGETMEKAKASYVQAYYKSMQRQKEASKDVKAKKTEITVVAEIVERVQEGNAYYFKLKGLEGKTFYAYSSLKPEIRWKATKIKISYNETNLKMVPIGEFTIVE